MIISICSIKCVKAIHFPICAKKLFHYCTIFQLTNNAHFFAISKLFVQEKEAIKCRTVLQRATHTNTRRLTYPRNHDAEEVEDHHTKVRSFCRISSRGKAATSYHQDVRIYLVIPLFKIVKIARFELDRLVPSVRYSRIVNDKIETTDTSK